MAQPTILIADDSDSIRAALRSVLPSLGFATLLATDGAQAVEVARRERPDAILLDIMMPVLDGWGALKQLKADPATAGIPVIALTALRLTDEQVHAAGFAGYLHKPITAHRLKEELDRSVASGG